MEQKTRRLRFGFAVLNFQTIADFNATARHTSDRHFQSRMRFSRVVFGEVNAQWLDVLPNISDDVFARQENHIERKLHAEHVNRWTRNDQHSRVFAQTLAPRQTAHSRPQTVGNFTTLANDVLSSGVENTSVSHRNQF